MSRILVIMLMMTTFALASEAEHGGSDIVQRTVNFILFAGLVWYLVADPIKNFFTSRSQSIADDLEKVQARLKESAALKQEAEEKVVEAEKIAQELIASAKKESKILNDNVMNQCDVELEALVKQHASKMDFEKRAMVRGVVEDILQETLSQSADGFDKEAMANVILKKVA